MQLNRLLARVVVLGFLIVGLFVFGSLRAHYTSDASSDVNVSSLTLPVGQAEIAPLGAAQSTRTCTIDLLQNTHTCHSFANIQIAQASAQALAQIDLAPRYEFQYVRFDIHYGSTPNGWTVNIGDSSSNDGYAGDSGTQDHDAELQLLNNAFTIYGSDYTPEDVTLDGSRQLLRSPDLLAESRDVVIEIGDGYIKWDNGIGEAATFERSYLFALAGQADRGGPSNRTLYAAFNRVVSGRSDRVGSGVTQVQITFGFQPDIAAPESMHAPAPIEPNKKGMTWGYISTINQFEITRVGCYGRPRVDGTDDGEPCDPYVGDTLCTAELPILCLRDTDLPRPDYDVPNDDHFRNGWAEGHIDVTGLVPGTALISLAEANQLCVAALGEGYRMAEHHDGGGGWAWYAYGSVPQDTRFWTHINDQAGNCWD